MLPGAIDPETGEPIVTSRIVFVELADGVDGADVLDLRQTKTETAETVLAALLTDGEWRASGGLKTILAAAGSTIGSRNGPPKTSALSTSGAPRTRPIGRRRGTSAAAERRGGCGCSPRVARLYARSRCSRGARPSDRRAD